MALRQLIQYRMRKRLGSVATVAAPGQVADLTATAGDAQVTLAWTGRPGGEDVLSYEIRRDGVQIATTTNVNYVDTGRINGRPYSYDVRARNVGGPGPFSAVRTATPQGTAQAVPGQVAGLAGAVGDASVSLSWTARPSGENITRYNVYRDGVQVATPAQAFYVATGLINAQAYVFTVAAVNAAGEGAQSTSISRTPVAWTAPPVPPSSLDPTTYDYETNNRPRVPSLSDVSAPLIRSATASTNPAITTGDVTGVRMLRATQWLESLKGIHVDLKATGLNLMSAGLKVTDSEIHGGLAALITGGRPGRYEHVVADDTDVVGCGRATVIGSGIAKDGIFRSREDCLYFGEVERQEWLRLCATGNYKDPYVSKVIRQKLHTLFTGVGWGTYAGAFFNYSADSAAYPGRETPGAYTYPLTPEQRAGAIKPSTTTTTAAKIGDFLQIPDGLPAAGGKYGYVWQIVGTTNSAHAATKGESARGIPVTVGPCPPGSPTSTTASWPTGPVWDRNKDLFGYYQNRAHTSEEVFWNPAGGDAIVCQIGFIAHADTIAPSFASGHVLFRDTLIDNLQGYLMLQQNQNGAPGIGQPSYDDPSVFPFSHVFFENCFIKTDFTPMMFCLGTGDLRRPAGGRTRSISPYGWKASPHWMGHKHCVIDTTTGVARRVNYHGGGSSTAVRWATVYCTEAKRFDGVIAQLNQSGIDRLTAANNGVLPTGAQVAASEVALRAEIQAADDEGRALNPAPTMLLGAAIRDAEYHQEITIPLDGIPAGTPNNLSLPVFAARTAAGLPNQALDARTWWVWEDVHLTSWAGPLYNPSLGYGTNATERLSYQPWLASYDDGNGLYNGPVA